MQSAESLIEGEYTYGFSLNLPSEIPGSFVHKSKHPFDRTEVLCSYNLYVEMDLTAAEGGQNP